MFLRTYISKWHDDTLPDESILHDDIVQELIVHAVTSASHDPLDKLINYYSDCNCLSCNIHNSALE